MKFEEVLKECIENGKKITRKDWNGKDMFVCGIEDSLTDEDVECANKNECPYYIPNDDE